MSQKNVFSHNFLCCFYRAGTNIDSFSNDRETKAPSIIINRVKAPLYSGESPRRYSRFRTVIPRQLKTIKKNSQASFKKDFATSYFISARDAALPDAKPDDDLIPDSIKEIVSRA